jgi:hypothetical protein
MIPHPDEDSKWESEMLPLSQLAGYITREQSCKNQLYCSTQNERALMDADLCYGATPSSGTHTMATQLFTSALEANAAQSTGKARSFIPENPALNFTIRNHSLATFDTTEYIT